MMMTTVCMDTRADLRSLDISLSQDDYMHANCSEAATVSLLAHSRIHYSQRCTSHKAPDMQ